MGMLYHGSVQPTLSKQQLKRMRTADRPLVVAEPKRVKAIPVTATALEPEPWSDAWEKDPRPRKVRHDGIMSLLWARAGSAGSSLAWSLIRAFDLQVLARSAGENFVGWIAAHDKDAQPDTGCAVFSRRFTSIAALTTEERSIAGKLDHSRRTTHQAGAEISMEGDAHASSRLIFSGWAARSGDIRRPPSGSGIARPGRRGGTTCQNGCCCDFYRDRIDDRGDS